MSIGELPQIKLTARNNAGDLRRQLLDYIRNNRLEPGTRLATEAELVRSLKVSRSTVRRALDPLEKDGWIDRRAGSGTYVGARVGQITANTGDIEKGGASEQMRIRRDRGIVRVAVLVYKIGDLAHDWYTPGILEGLAHSDKQSHIIVELLGDREGDLTAISAQLQRSRPDALVVLSNLPHHAFVIRDAQNLGIPCFVSGTPHRALQVPAVYEDNRQAVALAAGHLLLNGHRYIGLVLPRLAEPWVFERLEAYTQSMNAAGLTPAVHWTSPGSPVDGTDAQSLEAFEKFVTEAKLTAILPCHLSAMLMLDALVRGGRYAVPGDLSVVSFEQDQFTRRYMGRGDADRIVFPLREMGARLAEMAQEAVTHGGLVSKSDDVGLPATLIKGSSVRSLF